MVLFLYSGLYNVTVCEVQLLDRKSTDAGFVRT